MSQPQKQNFLPSKKKNTLKYKLCSKNVGFCPMNEISMAARRTYLAQISLQGTLQSQTDKRFLS